jgi:hypothetical protein
MAVSRNDSYPRFVKRSTPPADENYVILEEGNTVEVSAALYGAKIGVDDSIRILKEEYADIDTHLPYFTHFNLQYGGMKIGRRYALPNILVQGYYKSDEDEFPPLLSFENCLTGTCVRVKEHVLYDDLTTIDFEYSMRTIRNIEQLKQAVLRRYRVSMPLISEEEMLRLGVSVTTLRLDEKSGEMR